MSCGTTNDAIDGPEGIGAMDHDIASRCADLTCALGRVMEGGVRHEPSHDDEQTSEAVALQQNVVDEALSSRGDVVIGYGIEEGV